MRPQNNVLTPVLKYLPDLLQPSVKFSVTCFLPGNILPREQSLYFPLSDWVDGAVIHNRLRPAPWAVAPA
jgi:hypothetical protein